MLVVKDLHVSVEGKEILKGLDLTINKGEVHAIMGVNGSGKSTLSKVIAGHEDYEVTSGSIEMDGQDILEMDVDERSREGVFLAFQYPMEIPGVSNANFIRAALNSRLPEGEELDAVAYYKNLYAKMDALEMDRSFTARAVNEGFSGGEKKRNELMQMLLLKPKLCILDETDSGLDIDALQVVAEGVNSQRSADRSFIVVTHYQRLLDYIKPDFVHVLSDGKIVKSGDASLAHELEAQGYAWLQKAPAEDELEG